MHRAAEVGGVIGAAPLLRRSLEHVPEKWLHFSDKNMLQINKLGAKSDSVGSDFALEGDDYSAAARSAAAGSKNRRPVARWFS